MVEEAWEKKESDSEDDYSETKRIKQQFRDYAAATSIHGITYIGESERHWVERYKS